MKRAWVVLVKEVVDNLRDRRSWFSTVILAVLGPLMLIGVIAQTSRLSANEASRPLVLPVSGAERAPSLIAFLRDHNVSITPAPADPEAAVVSSSADVVLVIPESYAADLSAGRPASVRVVYDESRTYSAGNARRLRDALSGYGSTVAQARLLARGISPTVVRPLAIENQNLSTPQGRAVFVLSLVPMFLLLSVFVGGMAVAIDVTAGERERGSLEPLLATPLSSAELVVGKLGAAALYAAGSLVLTAVAFALVLNLVPLEIPGMRLGLPLGRFCLTLALLLPAAPAASALEMMAVSTKRTFKEAQTTAQILTFIPMLPGLVSVFSPIKPPAWASVVPFLSHHVVLTQVFRGDAVRPVEVALCIGSTLLLAALAAAVTVRRYDRERVLFG